MEASTWVAVGVGGLVVGGGLFKLWRTQRLQSHRHSLLSQADQTYDVGDVRGAIVLLEALLVRAPELGADDAFMAMLYNRLARSYEGGGRLSDAIAMCRKEIEIVRKLWGPTDARLATSLHDLALLLHQSDAHEQALEVCREAVELGRDSLGPRHPEVAIGEKNLAELLLLQGEVEEAEALMLFAMESLRRVFGPEDDDVIAIRRALIDLYREQGNRERQRVYMQQDLAYHRKTLGEAAPETVAQMEAMAEFFLAGDDWREASLLYQERRELLEAQSPLPLDDWLPLAAQEAECLRQMGQLTQAVALFEEAIAKAPEDAELRFSLHNNLGAAQMAIGLDDAALRQEQTRIATEHYEKALAFAEAKGHNPAAAWHNLAVAAASEGAGAQDLAIERYRKALAANEAHLGDDHPDVARVLQGLVPLLEAAGANEEAEALRQRQEAIVAAASLPSLVAGALDVDAEDAHETEATDESQATEKP